MIIIHFDVRRLWYIFLMQLLTLIEAAGQAAPPPVYYLSHGGAGGTLAVGRSNGKCGMPLLNQPTDLRIHPSRGVASLTNAQTAHQVP